MKKRKKGCCTANAGKKERREDERDGEKKEDDQVDGRVSTSGRMMCHPPTHRHAAGDGRGGMRWREGIQGGGEREMKMKRGATFNNNNNTFNNNNNNSIIIMNNHKVVLCRLKNSRATQ